ncbi:MAG: ParB N-terminal domain-containing protein [Candidatus Peribacteria bacterium]|jgi:ParB-like chromosome segregation protein Spo0J|nr:ParB N-terminal domain-containing protein [Candidatus Peribacteria bacterium]
MKEKYHHLPINQLHEYELNNKIHPEEQLQALDYSIQKVGFRAPILIDENNVILAGHARYQSVKRL